MNRSTAGAAFVLALASAGTLAAQEVPTIRVPVHLVTLSTLAFSQENRLIPGLQASGFRVFDNGRVQKTAVEESVAPVSVALAILANQDVREYLPFVVKTGSVIDALLTGESGEAVVLAYGSEVALVKPFDTGDIHSALSGIRAARPESQASTLVRVPCL